MFTTVDFSGKLKVCESCNQPQEMQEYSPQVLHIQYNIFSGEFRHCQTSDYWPQFQQSSQALPLLLYNSEFLMMVLPYLGDIKIDDIGTEFYQKWRCIYTPHYLFVVFLDIDDIDPNAVIIDPIVTKTITIDIDQPFSPIASKYAPHPDTGSIYDGTEDIQP